MDENQVFIKTAEGEGEVRRRTRLVQRHLRNVLIMVDGYSTVGELSERFGDADAVRAALQELEQQALIETFERRIVREMKAGQGSSRPQAAEGTTADEPVMESFPSLDAAPIELEEVVVEAVSVEDMRTDEKRVDEPTQALTEEAAAPPSPHFVGHPLPPLIEAIVRTEEFSDAKSLPLDLESPRQMPPPKPTLWSRLLARKERLSSERRKKKLRASRRAGIRRSRTMRRAAWILGFAVLIVAPLSWLGYRVGSSADAVRAQLEADLSRVLGERVRIGKMALALTPRPGWSAENIIAGEDVGVASAHARPALLSLASDRWTIDHLVLEHVELREGGLARLAALSDTGTVAFRRIELRGVRLALGGTWMEPLSGDIEIGPTGRVARIWLRDAAARMQAELVPDAGGQFAVHVTAGNWTLPFWPGLVLESFNATGRLGPDGIRFSHVEGRAYGGLISGAGGVDWSRGAQMTGELELARADLGRLLAAVKPEVSGSGEVSLKMGVQAQAPSMNKLAQAVELRTSYEIKRGEIARFDLDEAVRSGLPTRGGVTAFDEMSGRLSLSGGAAKLSDLHLASGLMRTFGHVTVGADTRLEGALTVEIRGATNRVRTPLAIGGTLGEPVVGARSETES